MSAESTPSTSGASRSAEAGPGVEADGTAWHRGWLKVAVALVVAGQSMSFVLASNLSPPSGATYWWLQGGLFASAAIVLLLLAGPLVRECWSALRAGRITVDLLFFVTLCGTFFVSVYGSLAQRPTIYYDLVAILLAIYTVGKMLGARSRARALRAVDELRAEHDICTVIDAAGGESRRRVAEVKAGDRVRVVAGAAVPVDGWIREGRGLILTTPLTGELEPALFEPGAMLYAGMRSVDGVFAIEVTAAGGARRLDSMLREVEAARLQPSRVQNAADRLAARFVPVVVAASAATFAFWLWRSSLDAAIINSLAVMVVACPCALGLATPLGVWSGLVRLSRLGLVARTGDFLETLATADVAFFDKTGTLCEPALAIRQFEVFPSSPLNAPALRAAVAAAESGIDHPVAAALRTLPQAATRQAFRQIESRIVPGTGIRARVASVETGDEYQIAAGAPEKGQAGSASEDVAAGRVIDVAVNGVPCARVTLDETPRVRAAEVFAKVRELGLELTILTGDRNFPASTWPDVPRITGMAPEAKADVVREAQSRGKRVVYIGDGLNDAPALAVADASIAIRQGADLARGSAMAVLAGESLSSVPLAIRVARGVRHAIRSNLWLAAVYNTIGMAVAAAGMLHPVAAALLMAGSSVLVSVRVLRAGKA